jgi:hypothetical protein
METSQSSECDSENLSKANSCHQNSSYIIKKELSMTTLKEAKTQGWGEGKKAHLKKTKVHI